MYELVNKSRAHDSLAVLSEVEREILSLMAEGRSNQAIASPKPIETHVRSIFNNLTIPETPERSSARLGGPHVPARRLNGVASRAR